MKKTETKEINELFDAILLLKNRDECYDFFEDACTMKELIEISQRLRAAKLLQEGFSYVEIAKECVCEYWRP